MAWLPSRAGRPADGDFGTMIARKYRVQWDPVQQTAYTGDSKEPPMGGHSTRPRYGHNEHYSTVPPTGLRPEAQRIGEYGGHSLA